jgi:hypothetical protein
MRLRGRSEDVEPRLRAVFVAGLLLQRRLNDGRFFLRVPVLHAVLTRRATLSQRPGPGAMRCWKDADCRIIHASARKETTTHLELNATRIG